MIVFYSACVVNAVFIFRKDALVVLNLTFATFFVLLFVLQTMIRKLCAGNKGIMETPYDENILSLAKISSFFENIRKLYTWKNGLIWRMSLHVCLYSLAIIVAYNIFLEISRGYGHVLSHFTGNYIESPGISQELRNSIKETFPWATIVFIAFYLIRAFRHKGQDFKFSFKDYAMIVFYSACVVNTVFIFRKDALVVLNLAFLFFFVLHSILLTVIRKLYAGNNGLIWETPYDEDILSLAKISSFFENIRKLYAWKNDLIWRISLHVGLYSLAMVLSYNGYKEISRGYDHVLSHFTGSSMEYPELPKAIKYYSVEPKLPKAIRHSIEQTFPWAIFVFISFYFLQVFRCKRQDFKFNVKDYAIVVFSSACVINALFIFRKDALIVLNLSFLLFFVLLFILQTVIRKLYAGIKALIWRISLHVIRYLLAMIRLAPFKVKLVYNSIKGIRDNTINYIAIVSCMILGFLLYNVAFYHHTHMVNISSHAPLIELYTISATSLMIYLVYHFITVVSKSVYIRALFIVAILFVQINQFVKAYHYNPPIPMAAYDVLPKYEGKSFITSYHSVYPTLFTKQWVIPNWNYPISPENVCQSDYIWLKDKHSPEGEKYFSPEYLLYINRILAPPIDKRVKDTFEIVEQGENYEIYKLR